MTSDIIDKIRALFRKGAQAATQEEADLFIAKAQELLAKYNIDRATVEEAELKATKGTRVKIVEKRYKTGRQRYETDQYISRMIRSCWHVQTIWSIHLEDVRHERSGRVFHSVKERLVYVLVGDELDVEFCLMAIDEIHKMMRHLLSKHLRARGVAWSSEICHSFFWGFQSAFVQSNEREIAKVLKASEQQTQDQYAIVLVDKEKLGDEYITQNISTVRSRTRGQSKGGHDGEAYGAGAKAGATAKVGTKKLK